MCASVPSSFPLFPPILLRGGRSRLPPARSPRAVCYLSRRACRAFLAPNLCATWPVGGCSAWPPASLRRSPPPRALSDAPLPPLAALCPHPSHARAVTLARPRKWHPCPACRFSSLSESHALASLSGNSCLSVSLAGSVGARQGTQTCVRAARAAPAAMVLQSGPEDRAGVTDCSAGCSERCARRGVRGSTGAGKEESVSACCARGTETLLGARLTGAAHTATKHTEHPAPPPPPRQSATAAPGHGKERKHSKEGIVGTPRGVERDCAVGPAKVELTAVARGGRAQL